MSIRFITVFGIAVLITGASILYFGSGTSSLSGFPQNLLAAVTGTEQPDLSVGSVSPTSVVIGTPVTLSGIITNSGSKTTGSTFLVRFFIDNNSDHASVPYVAQGSESSLLPGATFTSTGSFTFPANPVSSTWYVQLCADMNSSRTGIIPESNENNNCSEWTAIAVSAPTTSDSVPTPSSSTPTPKPPTITATPGSGTAPLTVSITAVANTDSSCAEQGFVIFFGDKSGGEYFTVPKNLCTSKTYTVSHTYATSAPAVNTPSLWRWHRDAAGAIVVDDEVARSKDVLLKKPPLPSISVNPTTGIAPLAVSITAVANTDSSCAEQGFAIFFGDKSGGEYFTVPKNSCAPRTYTVSHTYATSAPAVNTPSLWRWHRDSAGAIVLDNELVRAEDVILKELLTYPSLHTTSVNRPINSPKLSDRILSSRWERTGTESTFGAVADFFSSRIDWNYSFQAAGTFIKKVLGSGLGYSGSINGQLPDGLDALNTTRLKGRDINVFGNYYTLPALTGSKTYVGDLSSPEYQSSVRTLVANYVAHGTRLIQIDDAGFQYNWVIDPALYKEIGNRRVLGGYGTSSLEYFTKVWLPKKYDVFPTVWELPFTRAEVLQMSSTSAVTVFRTYAKDRNGVLFSTLQDQFYEFHKQQFIAFMNMIKSTAGKEVSFSCNGGSYQFFGDENPSVYFGYRGSVFPFTFCDFFNSELNFNATTAYSSVEPEHMWSRARYIEAHDKVQIFNPPKFPAHFYTTDNAGEPDEIKETRKAITFAYGLGSWMVAPWDVYVANLNIYPNIADSLYRYFGKPSEYADLYRFIKANASYFDGYEHVYDTHAAAGHPGTIFNTPTVKGNVKVQDPAIQVGTATIEPVTITSPGRAYAFLRAKPGSKTAPSVIHLINYSDTPTITIELTNTFFGWPSNTAMTLEARIPGSYDALLPLEYMKTNPTGTLLGGKTRFEIPVSKEYALLIVAPR